MVSPNYYAVCLNIYGIRIFKKTNLRLLKAAAKFSTYIYSESDRLKPLEVVRDYEKTILRELDLKLEAANTNLTNKKADALSPAATGGKTLDEMLNAFIKGIREQMYNQTNASNENIDAPVINTQISQQEPLSSKEEKFKETLKKDREFMKKLITIWNKSGSHIKTKEFNIF